MPARIDEQRQLVCVNGSEWPFTLDLREGTASLSVGAQTWQVRPQRWVEKLRLARFAHWGEKFVRQQLWTMCVVPETQQSSDEEREAVLALADWLSGGGVAEPELPLDTAVLARVTAETCRQLGVVPSVLDTMPAYEVESLWRHSVEPTTEMQEDSEFGPPDFTHKIMVMPDEEIAITQASPSAGREVGLIPPENEVSQAPSPVNSLSAEETDAAHESSLTPPGSAEPEPRTNSVGEIPARGGLATREPSPPSGQERSKTSAAPQPSTLRDDNAPQRSPRPNPGAAIPVSRSKKRTPVFSRFRVVMGSPTIASVSSPERPDLVKFSEPTSSLDRGHSDISTPTPSSVKEQTAPGWIEQLFAAPTNSEPEHAPNAEEFANQFSERLRLAAEELGIIEGR